MEAQERTLKEILESIVKEKDATIEKEKTNFKILRTWMFIASGSFVVLNLLDKILDKF